MSRNKKRRNYFREFKRRWRAKNPAKVRAANMVKRLKRIGWFLSNLCAWEGCKEWATELHHPDYRRPREVVGFCRKHHAWIHYRKAA